MIDNEYEIVEMAKTGDTDAFCRLVEEYKEKALSIAFSFCRNHEDAKDVSQEAFIKAFKTIKYFRADSRFFTWFYRILINMCKDHLRYKKRNKMGRFFQAARASNKATEDWDIFEVISSDKPGPKQQLLNKELGEQLNEAIGSLPPAQKAIFMLKNIHGLKISEIAEITKCAQGTVKAHLFKATINLKEILKEYLNVEISGGVV